MLFRSDELQGIRSPKVAWDKGEQVNSIPDAFGTALRRYLDGDVDRAAYPQQQRLGDIENESDAASTPETDGGAAESLGGPQGPTGVVDEDGEATEQTEDATQSLIDAGESPECPDCGAMALYYSEGCKTCESCGWSEC